MKKKTLALSASAIIGLILCGTVSAANILCETITNNHTLVDDAIVSACIDAGLGNIGNGANDDFLLANPGPGYIDIGNIGDVGVGGSFVQSNNTGTFSFNPSLWNSYGSILIGFKFGTGNTPDEWMVYSLQSLVSAGSYTFVDVLAPGDATAARLSHISLYSDPRVPPNPNPDPVPEPTLVWMLGLGLLGLVGYKRKQAKLAA
jgi:hypothetical protein